MWRWRIRKAAPWLILAVIALMALAVESAFLFGRGGRGFFSVDTLEVKSQSEYLIPVLEVPVYRSSYGYGRYELVNYLIDKGYWKADDTREPRWKMFFHWNDTWRDGDSALYREVSLRRQDWMDWTEAHPDFARDFWPWVLEELRKDPSGDAILNTMGWVRISKCSREEYDVHLRSWGPEDGLLSIPSAENDDN